MTDWVEEARKEMRLASGNCTELSCMKHGEVNRTIYDRHKAKHEREADHA